MGKKKKDIDIEIGDWQRVIEGKKVWQGTAEDFLQKAEVKKSAEFFEDIYGRIFRAVLRKCHVLSHKTNPQRARALALQEDELLYVPEKLARKFFGRERELAGIRRVVAGAVIGNIEQRKILHLVGEPASGKTDIIKTLADLLSAEEEAIFVIKDCPVFDHPRRLIPQDQREEYSRKYNVYLDPREDICRKCQMELHKLLSLTKDRREREEVWKKMLVQKIKPSPARREIGFNIIHPVETLTTDVSDLIGTLNLPALIDGFPEGHPKTLLHSGKLSRQQQIVLIDEITRNPSQRLGVLLDLAQGHLIPGPANYGLISTDIFLVGTSNIEIWEEFASDKANRPFVSRMETILFRNNLAISQEVKIYEKLFEESAAQFYGLHAAPHVLRLAAFQAIASRLPETSEINLKGQKGPLGLEQIIRVLDGEYSSDLPLAKDLYEQNPRLGLQPGLDVRFTQGDMEKVAGERLGTEKSLCLLPRDLLLALKRDIEETFFIELHQTEKNHYSKLVPSTEEYWQKLLKPEALAILKALFSKEGQELFDAFILAIQEKSPNRASQGLMAKVAAHLEIWNEERKKTLTEQLKGSLNMVDFDDLFFACLMAKSKEEEDFLQRLAQNLDKPDFSEYKIKIEKALIDLGYRECCAGSVIPYILVHLDKISKAA